MIRTDKKNQHYIPKFYLRNFSFQNNLKQIGLFNKSNLLYFQTAKLKTQASKDFFYGFDGKVEDNLSNIESSLAITIRKILLENCLPTRNSLDYFNLLIFIALTDLRNPTTISNAQSMLSEMRKRILESAPESDVKRLVPEISHENMVKGILSQVPGVINAMLDLDYKLLVNETQFPFICSDFPVVKYNQFLESKKWDYSITGYGLIGFQVFIPLNSKLMLLFYDSNIYKVGNKNSNLHKILLEKDITSINKLQVLNCFENIYFNEEASKNYIDKLYTSIKNYSTPNQTKSELSFLHKDNDEENAKLFQKGFKNFMMINKTECKIGLDIEGIKIHSKGKRYKLESVIAPKRPKVKD